MKQEYQGGKVMLSERELRNAFGVGIHVLLSGMATLAVTVIAKYIPLDYFWGWGLGLAIVGFSICTAAVMIALLQWKPGLLDMETGCEECKYFHGYDNIHCAVHPYGKEFEECKDFDPSTQRRVKAESKL